MIDTGWSARSSILQADAERKLLGPLRVHGWTTTIESTVKDGEYLVMSATRGKHRRSFAIMYTGWTGNEVYRRLEREVEVVFINAAFDGHEAYTRGIVVPRRSADEFAQTLVEWNRESVQGKFAPETESPRVSDELDEDDLAEGSPRPRFLLSETPVEALWLRLRQLQSVRLARRIIEGRCVRAQLLPPQPGMTGKAEGVAYALRNAHDYYQASQSRNLSQRVLNLYYGTMAFAFAEMLAHPEGPSTLSGIEDSTKRGHGLFTLDGRRADMPAIVVGALQSGFFATWMRLLGRDISKYFRTKPKQHDDLTSENGLWASVETLFARIPETSDLFLDVFESPCLWLHPAHDGMANLHSFTMGGTRPDRTYGIFTDMSGRLGREDIALFPGPISEITELPPSAGHRRYRAGVDHQGLRTWWDALAIHTSPLGPTALILPLFGDAGEYRVLCFVLLYALSIVVRYRPSVWRRIQEGDEDHLRVLVEAFLVVVERVLPQHFLESVTGERVLARQGGLF